MKNKKPTVVGRIGHGHYVAVVVEVGNARYSFDSVYPRSW